jgi:transcriptional regulator with XRE-family HTH domain
MAGYQWEQRRKPLLRSMVGDVLRRTRLDQGRTLADVARAARVSMPYLSELERGRKEASSEVLAALCAALDLELAELLAEIGRDLLDDRAQHSQVIRLTDVRGSRVSGTGQPLANPGPPGSRGGQPSAPDAQCLLAAA